METLETRALLTTVSFQDGVAGYAGTDDTILYSREPAVNFGTETGMSVDQQDVGGVRQGLMKFSGIFGSESGQIPLGSTINSATLTVSVFNDSNASMQMSMYRMNTEWDESLATWNSFGAIGGVQASEGEVAGLPPDAILFDGSTGVKTFDVTDSLRYWSAGDPNFGWLIESAATNGWDFNTSEAALADRPLLTVDYTAPNGPGTFRFLELTPTQAEGDAGTSTALLEIARVGGVAGAVSVDYTISAGTATAGADFVAEGPITVSFAEGETRKTVPVTINGDALLEGLETVLVSLSNAQGGAAIAAGADGATLTIGDDDALINEVLANVTNAEDETNREYIELIGTPGASLNDYYFVVFEGEEEEGAGGSGVADFVVSLAGQTFGANGILVITPTAWAYTKDAASNQFATAALDGVGGVLEDSSQTYALIRSPNAPIVQGTDYDTVGAYESASQTAIGVGVGILDQLPAGAQLVDSVGVVEGGGGDRDRVATLEHPGIHVHQPEGFGGGNVASDAVSRRFGARTPNSIGVWYNGDLPSGAIPAAYANGTTAVSVVAPPGAQVTPGAPNILRTVAFAVEVLSVDEAAGTVALNVTRSGDDTSALSVDYATVDGVALAGQDFIAAAGTLNFAPGDSTETIEIALAVDDVAEGFESFQVQLSNATAPFLFTAPTATITIVDANVLVRTFQDGADEYAGTADATLNSVQPDDPFGFTTVVSVDEEVGSLTGSDARPAQALLRFDDIFGDAVNQVPAGAQIFSGFLTLNVNNPTAGNSQVRFFRMLQDWDEGTANWTDPRGAVGGGIVNGITPDDVEAAAEFDSIVTNPAGSGPVEIPLSRDTLQAWANGSLPNFGWSIISDSGDDWNFTSSDAFDPALAPKLTILYTAPSGAGTFGFAEGNYKVNENGTASVIVQRSGGSTGAVSVNYEITAGTGGLADIQGPAAGTLEFADGELFKTISIPINNDTELERNETLNLALSGEGLAFDRSATVLTIRDNDFNIANPTLLLNEFFINSPGNDGGHEFAELAGLAGAGMGSLYLAVFDGDVGPGEGSTDLVVDLGPYLNGANGLTLVTALNTFGFAVPSEATRIARPELDIEVLSNDTATYALLYSPTSSLTTGAFDYDWNNDATLELPAGVFFVDSIAVQDNGANDRAYGPAGNTIESNSNPNLYVADAISRKRGNNDANSAAAWFHGDLVAAGDDPLVYDAPNSTALPVAGAALTPGKTNTGAAEQSPLVSLSSVVPNSLGSAVTLTFNGPVSQFLAGGGAAGATITQPDGNVDPRVDTNPHVAGIGTNTLTLTFSGAGVLNGRLPAGQFRLNFVGNSLIGNGRAVDAANSANASGSDFQFTFTVTPGLPGDIDGNGSVDLTDFGILKQNFGTGTTAAEGDANGDGKVDLTDFGILKQNFGTSGSLQLVSTERAPSPAPRSAISRLARRDQLFAQAADDVFAAIGREFDEERSLGA